MSFGLGYIADGFLKGQQRNRDWSLRQKQEERAQKSFGLQQRIGEAQATSAENDASEENLARINATRDNQLKVSGFNVDNAGIQKDINQNNLTISNEGVTPEAIARRQEMAGLGLDTAKQNYQNAQTQAKGYKLKNEYQEYLNSDKGKQIAKENSAWEQHYQDILNQTNEATAKVQLSEAMDNKRLRMIQLIRSGDPMGAAMMINSSKDNDLENVATFEITKDGGIVGYSTDGSEVASFSAEQIKGVEERVKARTKKDEKPKIQTEKIYNEMGDVVGEKLYIVKTDPQTGTPYKQYLQEAPASQGGPVADLQDRIDTVDFKYERGEISKDQYAEFMQELGQPVKSKIEPEPNKEVLPSDVEAYGQQDASTTVSNPQQPAQAYAAPRMNQGLPASNETVAPENYGTRQRQSSSPRNQQDVVGGLNQFIEDNMSLQGNQYSRPLSRRIANTI